MIVFCITWKCFTLVHCPCWSNDHVCQLDKIKFHSCGLFLFVFFFAFSFVDFKLLISPQFLFTEHDIMAGILAVFNKENSIMKKIFLLYS